ncbi:MAG: hypothetical protein U0491_02370 [Candidatus Saccharimonadales bacterium]
MATKKPAHRQQSAPVYNFKFRKHRFSVLLDDVLIFRFFRRLHGRFWGLAGILGLTFGLSVCFMIRPDMLMLSTAFSDFGLDVRTAPFFVLSVFFAAYGLWRWRNYLSRTLKRQQPILTLITFTIIGLYMVALAPVSWHPWPYKIHFLGMTIVGVSMAATVIFDILLSKTRKKQDAYRTRIIKLVAFASIIIGGFFTFGSSSAIHWFNVALLGELWMLFGYSIWIALKTFQGEDPRSALSRQLKKIVLID